MAAGFEPRLYSTAVVVTTAGHVDHGKTALIKALTRIDPDRLPEERHRGMTIDVGYAFLTLPSGSVIDFIDVPGHEDLLSNMITGAAQADAFVLAVDAGEGFRAQTHEHIEVLRSLGLAAGVVAVTKTDLVDAQRLQATVRECLERAAVEFPTFKVPVVPVSSLTGAGLNEFAQALGTLRKLILEQRDSPATRVTGPCEVTVDRVVHRPGAGLIATGTMRGGVIHQDDRVFIHPTGAHAVVAELQRWNARVTSASGSGRLALRFRRSANVSLRRGVVLTTGGGLVSANQIIVRAETLKLRPGAEMIVHNATDRVSCTIGRLRWTDDVHLVELRLSRPTTAAIGRRLVLRHGDAICTATILAIGARSWSRLSARTALRISSRDVDAVVEAHIELNLAVTESEVRALYECRAHPPDDPPSAVNAGGIWLANDFYTKLRDDFAGSVSAHASGYSIAEPIHRLAQTILRESAITRPAAISAARAIAHRLLTERGVSTIGDWVAGTIILDGDPRLAEFARLLSVANSPPFGDAIAASNCPKELAFALVRSREIVRLSADVAYVARTYANLVRLAWSLAGERPLTPAQLRDSMGASRRHALAVLEDLNARGVLIRTPRGHVRGHPIKILADTLDCERS